MQNSRTFLAAALIFFVVGATALLLTSNNGFLLLISGVFIGSLIERLGRLSKRSAVSPPE